MNQFLKYSVLIIALSFLTLVANAQRKKVDYSGTARTVIDNSKLTETDTLNNDNINSGYMQIDLGFNIAPNDVTDIKSVIRFKNPYGGFYGVGATIDFRELYIRGIIANKVKYQFGDFMYQMTPFTFYNSERATNVNEASVFSMMRELNEYDNFMVGNKWWQQGATAETKLLFDKGIESILISGFMAKNRTTNYFGTPDVLQGGGYIKLKQSKYFNIGGNFINLFSLRQTANTTQGFNNKVATTDFSFNYDKDSIALCLSGETGMSSMKYINYDNAPNTVQDYFYKLNASTTIQKIGLGLSVGYRNVGPEFLSPGAQTMRTNFDVTPSLFGHKVNSTTSRFLTIADVINDEATYNVHIDETLMSYDAFSRVLPYGEATPNRKGFDVNLNYGIKKLGVDANVGYASLSEIQKYGTDNYRKFSAITAKANILVNKMIGWKKEIKLSGGIKLENVSRKGDTIQSTKLSSTIIDAGLDIEVLKNFDLLTGIKMANASGNEIGRYWNQFNEIESYSLFKIDQQQTLKSAGVRYRFNEKTYLTLYAQMFDLKDKKYNTYDINFNKLMLVFNMKF